MALGDFRHSRQEIEALSIVKMKELCRMYAKKDSNEKDSWRAVAQDVCDTVGIGEERSPPTEEGGGGGGGGETGEGGEKKNVYDLKAHIDKLTDILEVSGKDLEMWSNQRSAPLSSTFVTPAGGEAAEQHEGRGDQSSEGQNDQDGEHHTCPGTFTHHFLSQAQQRHPETSLIFSRLQDDDMNSEEGESPPGDGGGANNTPQRLEVRVQKLMDEDPAFRRGRLRWLKQEQQRILNLQQQNITKKLRGQNQNQNQGQWLPFPVSNNSVK